MTTKVETSSRLQLFCEWKMTGIDHEEPQLFSKKFMNNKTELLRVGMKTPGKNSSSNRPSILFLLTANLQKKGLKVLSVTYLQYESGTTWNRFKEIKMDQNDLKNEGNNNEDINDGAAGIQLFTSPFVIFENSNDCDFPFLFTVNLTSIVNNYRVQQMDGLLSQQLRSNSIKNQPNGASVKLISNDGKGFLVPKWMLVARSPVLEALFSSNEDIGSIHLAVDCTVNEMKQFILFIYTGKLEGLVSHVLMQLAAKYQIKTLEDLCQTAFEDAYALSADKMAIIAWHLDSGSRLICNEKNEPDGELFEKKCPNVHNDLSIFTCTWTVKNLGARGNQEPIKRSVSFEHRGKKLFRAWLEMSKGPDHPEKYTFSALKFLSYEHESMCYHISQVTCSIDGQDQNSFTHQQIIMTKTEPKDENTSLQVFTSNLSDTEITTPFICPFAITFHAELCSTVAQFINVPVDVTWSEQLWAAAVNRKLTDVEFLVGEEAFGAHRSLLSVRSPVFAAMFASGMKEAETGRVRIEDVDPNTFQRFLKFLYTGMLEPSAMDEKLFTVADKYQVTTLMKLCRPATEPANTDDSVLNTFLSC